MAAPKQLQQQACLIAGSVIPDIELNNRDFRTIDYESST